MPRRPPHRLGDPLNRVVNVRLTDSEYHRYLALAQEHDVAISVIFRALLRWVLEQDDRQPEDDDSTLTTEQLVRSLVTRELHPEGPDAA